MIFIYIIFCAFALSLMAEIFFIRHKKIPIFSHRRLYVSFGVDVAIVLVLGVYILIKTFA